MTDTTRIAVIGAAGWAGRQVPMIGLRSPIRVGSSLGHTASASGASPGRRIRTAFCSGADIECSPVIRWTCRESRVCAVTSWHRDHAPQAIRAALTDLARGGPLPRAPWVVHQVSGPESVALLRQCWAELDGPCRVMSGLSLSGCGVPETGNRSDV